MQIANLLLPQGRCGLQVREGLLFVWPLPGPEAFIHSAAVQPAGSQVFAQVSPGIALSLLNANRTKDASKHLLTASGTASTCHMLKSLSSCVQRM